MSCKRLSSILLNALVLAVFAAALVLAARGQAAPPAHEGEDHPADSLQPGNYCVSCHTADDERLLHATEWRGGSAVAQYSDCPAYKRIQEELYYTERLLSMIDQAGRTAGIDLQANPSLAGRLQAGQEGYLRLLDQPVTSLEAFVAEAQGLRYKQGKVYSEISQTIEQGKRTRTLIVAIVISLLIALSLGWGLYNTRHVHGGSWKAQGWKKLVGSVLFLLLVFVFFALPLLRPPAEPVTATTPEAQAMQAALDSAQRSATTADRALARAWMLSQVGAAWSALPDAAKSREIWKEALEAAAQAEMNEPALWGQANKAQEAAASNTAALEKAGLIASQLDAGRARTWELSLMAEAWKEADPETARAGLDQAMETAAQAEGIYRDLDLRKVALQAAALEPAIAAQAAAPVIAQIEDPAIQAWAWRELAAQTGSDQEYQQAAAAAREISDPVRKAMALGRIAAQSGTPELFTEARQAITGLNREDIGYAWASLAALSQDAALVEQIPAKYPAAQAAALASLNQEETLAQLLSDPYELGRAQAQTVAGLAKSDPQQAQQVAGRMRLTLFQDRALRDLAIASGNATLVSAIQSPYLRTQALTGLGQYADAAALAGQLKEAYPLAPLAMAWAKTDPQAALALVDQMPREADRAAALIAIAAQTQDPAIFERALGMALAARVRGDALAPAQASLALAQAFAPIEPAKAQLALEQAYQAARGIAVK